VRPYRARQKTRRPAPRPFAFRQVTLRLGVDRFELGVWDREASMLGLGLLAVVPQLILSLFWLAGLWALGIPYLYVTARCVLVITTQGASIEHRLAGITWKSQSLGLRPRVELTGGWGWEEIAIHPRDADLRLGLVDDERAVLVDWWDDDDRTNEAQQLVELASAQVARLHG
jgi:hypothetical protein